MLRVVIVDDEQPAIDVLKIMLKCMEQVEIIGEYTKSSVFLRDIEGLKPDVVFLDIEMPGINGVDLAIAILEKVVDVDIVFVTAFRNYAVEAFALNAVDYLLKPALQKDVDRAVSRLQKKRLLRCATISLNTAVHIKCLGRLEVNNSSGERLIKWRTTKVEELFAFLLYHRGMVVGKGKIIDSLWHDNDPATSNNNLHTTVYKLKKVLYENSLDISIKFSGGGYIMELGLDISCDTNDFEQFIGKGMVLSRKNIAEFEQIIALYKGDYLEEKDYYWCISERARIQKNYSELVKQTACYYIDVRDYKKAEKMLLNSLGHLPYDEEVYEILLRNYFLQGDRMAMMKHYTQLESILQNELGVEPRPSLKRLYENFMNDC